MQYNYHCNQVVILNWELPQFWLFLAAFGTPLTWSFPIKKTHKTFIYITVNILRYIIWEIVFPEYFNKKLSLFVDLYLSPNKLGRKIYLCGRFYVRVGHGNSTPLSFKLVETVGNENYLVRCVILKCIREIIFKFHNDICFIWIALYMYVYVIRVSQI